MTLFLTIAQSDQPNALDFKNAQWRAALACTGAYKHTSTGRLLLELNWIPL